MPASRSLRSAPALRRVCQSSWPLSVGSPTTARYAVRSVPLSGSAASVVTSSPRKKASRCRSSGAGGRTASAPSGRTSMLSATMTTTRVAGSARSLGTRSGSARRWAARSRLPRESGRSPSGMDAVGRDTPVTLRAGPAWPPPTWRYTASSDVTLCALWVESLGNAPSRAERRSRDRLRWHEAHPPNGGEVRGQRWPTEYRVGVTRTPAYLAAVASSAVPGLDAVAVRAARGAPGNRCDVGFVTDTQRRAWVVRVPTTSAIGAQLDTAADLLPLLHRRVPYSVPLPRGFLAVPEGRAVVYPYLHGRSVVLSEVIPGPGVAAEIGRAVAALHNVERAVFDEAGVPVYDAEMCRNRHLGDLDRGAATGHVPTALLSRWERALEDVSAWRFAPTPVHADLSGGRFLVTFADDENPETASVRAVTGWEHAKIADPADDFAVLVAECSPETFESIVEAYSVARIERPDRHLRHRARLVSELRLLSQLLDAVHAAEPPLITRRAAELRALDERTANEPDLVVTEPEVAPRLPTGGPVATYAAAGAAPTGGVDDVPDVLEDDTQLLKTGPAADATAVIPAEELDRLRGEPAPAPEPGTSSRKKRRRSTSRRPRLQPSPATPNRPTPPRRSNRPVPRPTAAAAESYGRQPSAATRGPSTRYRRCVTSGASTTRIGASRHPAEPAVKSSVPAPTITGTR